MNKNNNSFVRMALALSMVVPSVSFGMETLPQEVREIIMGMAPDLKQAINFLAWRPFHTFEGHTDDVSSVAVADGIIVTVSRDRIAKVWDSKSYKELATLIGPKGYRDKIQTIAIANGNIVIGSKNDYDAAVWGCDIKNYKKIMGLGGFFTNNSLVVADGIVVANGLHDNSSRIWKWDNDDKIYKTVTLLRPNFKNVDSVAVADGIIVTGSSNSNFAKVWDRNNYKELVTLKGNSSYSYVKSVAVADGIIVTGSWDGTAKVWDSKSFKELATLEGGASAVSSVAVADGIIVTGSYDGTAKIWDRNSYKELATLKGHSSSINSVAVADDGIIITGSNDGTAKVWDSKPFEGTIESNPLLWIIANNATVLQLNFIKRACDATSVGSYLALVLPKKFEELKTIKKSDSLELMNAKIYFSFPAAVREYLRKRLNFRESIEESKEESNPCNIQ